MNKLCEQAPLYFYGELDEKQAAQFRAHLANCSACKREIAFMQQTQAALVAPAAPQAVVEAVLRKPQAVSSWRRVYKWALAATLVIGLGVWGFWGVENRQAAVEEEDLGWLAYVSEDLDTEYYNFMTELEAFEEEF